MNRIYIRIAIFIVLTTATAVVSPLLVRNRLLAESRVPFTITERKLVYDRTGKLRDSEEWAYGFRSDGSSARVRTHPSRTLFFPRGREWPGGPHALTSVPRRH